MNLDSTYISIAELVSQNSKATRAKVGAVLVTNQGVLLTGYNGTPHGWNNDCEDAHNITKPEVIHAELNCILKAAKQGVSVVDSVVYVTLSPCVSCSAMLAQAGVKKVYYREQYREKTGVEYLQTNGVIVEQI